MKRCFNEWLENFGIAELELPDSVSKIPSMLTRNELATYYLAAREQFTFSGLIVDCGVLTGSSTCSLICGVLDNPQRLREQETLRVPIVAYDRFTVGDDLYRRFFDAHYQKRYASGDCFKELFLDHVKPFRALIDIQEGDILKKSWRKDHFIELLCLDICKRASITRHIAMEFFTNLSAARSVVIQQDYSSGWQPHAVYVMEMFSDKFEKIFEVDDLAAFRCIAQIDRAEVDERWRHYHASPGRLVSLMDQAIQKARTPETLWFTRLSKARLLGQLGRFSEGLSELDSFFATADEQILSLATFETTLGNELQNLRIELCRQRN